MRRFGANVSHWAGLGASSWADGLYDMGTHMKTTIEISDALLREARRLARERGTTLRSLLEAAVRREISALTAPERKFELRDASFGGEGVQPGIDLSDWGRIRRMIFEEGRGG